MSNNKVVIVGAGPAGLTAALELQESGFTDITIIEADNLVGGISRTVQYKGNRIDIGGHRFFSKSDWVMRWWQDVMPLADGEGAADTLLQYQGKSSALPIHAVASREQDPDSVMLLRDRLSRIYFGKQFFDYPLKLNLDSLRKLGLVKVFTYGLSYVAAKLRPVKPEVSLQDFLINRFGEKLYRQFFKEYTEKVWGVSCDEISAEWGGQRIKSLSILGALAHALKKMLGLEGKAAHTSLIERFIYPKFGPGQMWEQVAASFVAAGGRLEMNSRVVDIGYSGELVESVGFVDANGDFHRLECDQVISTMPIKDLVAASRDRFSVEARGVAKTLQYRDFITVGLLYAREDLVRTLNDNWIYIQEPGVKVGRVQIFNNWSPYMVADQNTVWLGLEFFCKETDSLWLMDDDALRALAQKEMCEIGLVSAAQAIDSVAIRVPKAYPGYFGEAYKRFDVLRKELDEVRNLFLVGRNGMHRYNNQDHSMLTAKEAVEQIVSGQVDKERIWAINVDDEYHEEK
ncbi:NAD(P)/FAD-dependent oxidoreductase [Pseudomonas sp. ATCC 13867]|uniref:NAD(P)/FAD-dependent oxidoreductase n=1 Tax=Pseudomonas sp. ATCC 13867 TaxID=1294143 RepID=UPI0003462154|nr:NAD(P)/FAD-dependent oxidoreductase [Pseudomonas sp. ATCC 13867]